MTARNKFKLNIYILFFSKMLTNLTDKSFDSTQMVKFSDVN